MGKIKNRKIKVIRDLTLIFVSIAIAIFVYKFSAVPDIIYNTSLPIFILLCFLSGIFFASTFTVAIASAFFLMLGKVHNPVLVIGVGSMGAILGDTLIFKFLKDDLISDFEYLVEEFGNKFLKRIVHSKLIFWFAPIIAAILIASPFPDELGLLVFAQIKMKYKNFLLVSAGMNTLSIILLTAFSRFFK